MGKGFRAVAAVWTLATIAAAQPPGEVLVSAASSLTDVLQVLANRYERQGGERLVLNFGASNTLARQVSAGAHVDVFISADERQMEAIAAAVLPGTRVDLLSNQLAIAVPDDRVRRFSSARDLMDPGIRRISVGDPAAVPAGIYARAYLESLGIWSRIESKIVPVGSVRLALAAVESGAADAAIVYRTDIRTAKRAREGYVVPRGEGPRIVYPAAAMKMAANPDGARRLLAFLQGAEAREVFERAGFLAPSAKARR